MQGGAAGGGAEQVHQRLLDRVQTLQAELHRQSGEREREMIYMSSLLLHLCQGPIYETVSDFWSCVTEHEARRSILILQGNELIIE